MATAGDVNGDGYADVVVGANFHDASGGVNADRGRAYVYLGSASGLATSPAWTGSGDETFADFGFSVATAGDVNGDGYADVVVGADFHDAGAGVPANRGRAYVYSGGEGGQGVPPQGVPLLPRQLRSDLSAPIPLGGRAYEQEFGLGLTLRSPLGGAGVGRLQWQLAPWGGTFDNLLNPIQSDSEWHVLPAPVTKLLDLPESDERYLWRARVQYDPAQSPFVAFSRWVTISGNSLYEADVFSTSQPLPPPCAAPDEEVYISLVTLDLGGKPVLHSTDPNPASEVTGYNIYRSASPAGPWTPTGSNVEDMDAGTPNHQYVDQTGNTGSSWFYRIASFNFACGAEGPW